MSECCDTLANLLSSAAFQIGIESSEFKPIFDALEEVEGEGENQGESFKKLVVLKKLF